MAHFDAVLFDLDGTLIDSVDLIVDSYRHVFAVHSIPALSRDEIMAGVGTPLRSVFNTMTSDPDEITAWIATYREYNLAHHDARVHAYDGVVAMIHAIHDAVIPLGLVTSKNHAGAVRGLTLVGIGDAMDVIIGADDVTHPKPHPEPVLAALAALGVSASRAVFIGDSHHDIHAGCAAHVTTVGVTWGPFDRAHLAAARPDHFCDTPAELLQLIGI
ncbi:MAG TPA: HAD-IA family hydrolase [Gemmatimonadales bacterium]|jgi:pyrophosphatase PpaX